ncbi:MAG: anti-sigma F factor [Clostridia bacterium]|nr:anti-sigma F factor [Clostridia bacterium]
MFNKATITFLSISQNEAFARNAVASFMLPLNPTLSVLSDVKTAVSEAVTNAIVHGYPDSVGDIELTIILSDGKLHIEIKDYGVGIESVDDALEPFYTTKAENERSGMGFTVMKSFMDEFSVSSRLNEGTTVTLIKYVNENNA